MPLAVVATTVGAAKVGVNAAGAGVTTGVAAGAGVVVGATAGVAVDNVGLGNPAASGTDDCPANFSCVRPYALTPNTAHILTWNKPPPCSVIGTH